MSPQELGLMGIIHIKQRKEGKKQDFPGLGRASMYKSFAVRESQQGMDKNGEGD